MYGCVKVFGKGRGCSQVVVTDIKTGHICYIQFWVKKKDTNCCKCPCEPHLMGPGVGCSGSVAYRAPNLETHPHIT